MRRKGEPSHEQGANRVQRVPGAAAPPLRSFPSSSPFAKATASVPAGAPVPVSFANKPQVLLLIYSQISASGATWPQRHSPTELKSTQPSLQLKTPELIKQLRRISLTGQNCRKKEWDGCWNRYLFFASLLRFSPQREPVRNGE
ncbi:hypothetical protein XELAEV_18013570mg [Xenopus laevis]|uniref:Uncharacterized protein n=1 Tax=Xenopus laevis TaxID=8355 RepID=A0A974HZS0_XENLA|nr:hypothetical protein XELAEV_18013570mg [Xenopus laevis]